MAESGDFNRSCSAVVEDKITIELLTSRSCYCPPMIDISSCTKRGKNRANQ